MDVEDYLKNRHKKNLNSNSTDSKTKYLKLLVKRILLSIIIIISVCIYLKLDDKNLVNIKKYFFEDSIKFTKFNKWYKNNLGELIPSIKNETDMVFSSNDIKTYNYVTYHDGVKINTNTNMPFSALMGGIVVFIGEKEEYGKTLIIQGNDGIDYWYGNIKNLSVNLYDYIEKDTLLGEVNSEYLYLVLQKNGNFIKYEEIL